MLSPVCQAVFSSVQEALQARNVAPPTSAVAEHIAGCTHCRGALMLLAAAVFEPPRPAEETDCDMCQEYLSSYIDQEIVDVRTAIQMYPQVWWHLWSCVECAEIYEFTRRLVDAERVGILTPLPRGHPTPAAQPDPSLPSSKLPLFNLKRDFLFWAFSGQPSRTRTSIETSTHEVVLFEGEAFDHDVQLRVTQIPDQLWHMTITITPPIAGWLTLTLNELHRRIQFDSQGVAFLPDIPAAVLCSSEGSDLIGSIELDSKPDITL
jgi:hypothetical protein